MPSIYSFHIYTLAKHILCPLSHVPGPFIYSAHNDFSRKVKKQTRLCIEIIYSICKVLIRYTFHLHVFLYCFYLLAEVFPLTFKYAIIFCPWYFSNHVLIMSHHFMTMTLLQSDFITVKKQYEFTAEKSIIKSINYSCCQNNRH